MQQKEIIKASTIPDCFDNCQRTTCINYGHDTSPFPLCPEQPEAAVRRHRKRTLGYLLSGMKKTKAPTKTQRHGEHYEFLIGIGKDETAHITLSKEAYDALFESTTFREYFR